MESSKLDLPTPRQEETLDQGMKRKLISAKGIIR